MLATKIDTEARALRALWTIPQIVERAPWWDGERWEARVEVVLLDGETLTIDDVKRALTDAGWDVAWDYKGHEARYSEIRAYYPGQPTY